MYHGGVLFDGVCAPKCIHDDLWLRGMRLVCKYCGVSAYRFPTALLGKYCLNAFQVFVTSIGIPDFNFYIDKSSKQLKCRILTN